MAIPIPSMDEYVRRFWSMIDRSGQCWEWTRACNPHGYGMFSIGGRQKYKLAHRFSYELEHGEGSAEGKFVLHSCDNPKCCRPSHLHLGDQALNMHEASARKRSASGSRNGRAKLSEGDIGTIKSLLKAGVYQKEIASRFGVSQSAVSLIKIGTNWG